MDSIKDESTTTSRAFRYFSQELGYKRNRSDLTDALGSEAEPNFINSKVERRSNANILKSKKRTNEIERVNAHVY